MHNVARLIEEVPMPASLRANCVVHQLPGSAGLPRRSRSRELDARRTLRPAVRGTQHTRHTPVKCAESVGTDGQAGTIHRRAESPAAAIACARAAHHSAATTARAPRCIAFSGIEEISLSSAPQVAVRPRHSGTTGASGFARQSREKEPAMHSAHYASLRQWIRAAPRAHEARGTLATAAAPHTRSRCWPWHEVRGQVAQVFAS